MVDAGRLVGKKLALLIVGEDEQGKDDVVVFTGIVRQDGRSLILERVEGPFALLDEWLERVQPVDNDVRDILLDSDFVLPLSIGNLPGGANTADFESTRLKWPKRGET